MRISDWSSDVCSSDLEDTFGRLAVGLSAINPAAIRAADRNRRPPFASRSVPQSCGFRNQLVRGRIDIVSELDLDDGTLAVCAHPDRNSDATAFRHRGIQHACAAVFGLEPPGSTNTPSTERRTCG